MAGMQMVGYNTFKEYDGTNGTKEFTGIRLLGDYKFSVTVSADVPVRVEIMIQAFRIDNKTGELYNLSADGLLCITQKHRQGVRGHSEAIC